MLRMLHSRYSRWGAPLVATALAIGLIAVGANQFIPRADAAASLTALDRLIIEDDIRQRIETYALLADGDGIQRKDIAKLANTLMTPDVVSEIYAVGSKTPIRLEGRARHAGPEVNPPLAAEKPDLIAGRHYLVGTLFDQVSATEVRTRTSALHLDVTKNILGADCKKAGEDACGGRVVSATMWMYHMVWVKTAEGWQIKYNGLRRDM